jgi:hypothetical protein
MYSLLLKSIKVGKGEGKRGKEERREEGEDTTFVQLYIVSIRT